jgi:hypothetical protein
VNGAGDGFGLKLNADQNQLKLYHDVLELDVRALATGAVRAKTANRIAVTTATRRITVPSGTRTARYERRRNDCALLSGFCKGLLNAERPAHRGG